MQDENRVSKYMQIRIVSARALQIAQGAPPLIKAKAHASPVEIAKMEWEQGVIPIEARKRQL